jgi:hypothetical protein
MEKTKARLADSIPQQRTVMLTAIGIAILAYIYL